MALKTSNSWNFVDLTKVALPEDAAKVFNVVMLTVIGVKYEPIQLLATQSIIGTTYMILAKKTTISTKPESHLVNMIINKSDNGEVKLVSANVII